MSRCILFLGFIASLFIGGYVSSQYFYFEDMGNGYQQGCPESYKVKFTTVGHSSGAAGGILRVVLDENNLYYSHDITGTLFAPYSTPWPNWVDGDNIWINNYDDVLISRNNKAMPGLGVIGTYDFAHINFRTNYNPNSASYNVNFPIIYDGLGTNTSLSYGLYNIISGAVQNANLTGTISVLREPCQPDYIGPTISDRFYFNGVTKLTNLGIDIDLEEIFGSGEVPFVWRNGGVGIGTWTGDYGGNPWSINNQYGVDSGTLHLSVVGNGQSKTFDYDDFAWTILGPKTWHYMDRDYNITLPSGGLFNFGIEHPIIINYSVKDRLENISSKAIRFNDPVDPWVSNFYPQDGSNHVLLDTNISFEIYDDWAGVDSGSIVVTLSGLDNDYFAVYSGSDLNFSGLISAANTPDYLVELVHDDFPVGAEISVSVYAKDNENHGGILGEWSFVTRPSCESLACCEPITLQTGDISTQFIYPNTGLYISGGINPYLDWTPGNFTGYINCGTTGQGLSIYQGNGADNTGLFVGFTELNKLIINGTNVKAVLSGDTIFLTRISTNSLGGGGGGGSLTKDICEGGDNSPSYYDNECGEYHSSADICNINDSDYPNELKGAYLYSYLNEITTMCPIENANLDGYLQRNHFAKMISEFAVNVLGEEPEFGKQGCDSYNDIKGDTDELKYFMKTACELGLMGLNADGITSKESFDPAGYITRAQFGTVFSRLLFGDKYNVQDESELHKIQGYWYKAHLEALKENNIMTKIDGDWPDQLELRGWVMLMMKRADNYGVFAGKIPVLNGIKALFE